MTKTQTSIPRRFRSAVDLPGLYLVVLNSKGQRHAAAFEQADTVAVISRHLTRRDAVKAVIR